MSNTLRIASWNANGLNQRIKELEVYLKTEHIDIALISETHFTYRNYIKIPGYRLYHTTHPSGNARGGTAVLIKQNILHYEQEEIREEYLQLTIITINHNGADLNIAAAYCPPRHKIERKQYLDIFEKLGHRFVVAGDFNAKHTAWGSRLITPKGRELLAAILIIKCEVHSSGQPTYWPSDPDKTPDLLDIFISKGISPNYVEIDGSFDLTSDHTPVVMTLSTIIIKKKRREST